MTQRDPAFVTRLHPSDNIAVALRAISPGTAIATENVTARAAIPAGHKIATRAIAKHEPVLRYGQVIGFATADIAPGDHVHTQNVEMRDFARDYAFSTMAVPTQYFDPPATFDGIVRADGRVATRNYIGILTSVNCSATVARHIADHFRGNALADYPNVDGVVALTHAQGCGMASQGEGIDILRRTIGGYAK